MVDTSVDWSADISFDVTDDTDCDDGSSDVNPSQGEVCDTLDNDCNGFIDDDELVEITPKSIRLRKMYLKESDRKRNARLLSAARATG